MQGVMNKSPVKVRGLSWGGDPTFNAGQTRTAKATLTNQTAQDLICTTELYIDVTKVTGSGVSSPFTLPAGGSVDVSYTVPMPASAGGPYHVYIDVWSGSALLVHYQATEDVTIAVVPAVEIVKCYIRGEYPSVSEAYSGWIILSPIGGAVGLSQAGLSNNQVGVTIRNPTNIPLKYTTTIWAYNSWQDQTKYLTFPSVEPQRFPPAPTGLPYASYQYECDMFLAPGAELPPGKIGFVYTALAYAPNLYSNKYYLNIKSGNYDLGTTLLFDGYV